MFPRHPVTARRPGRPPLAIALTLATATAAAAACDRDAPPPREAPAGAPAPGAAPAPAAAPAVAVAPTSTWDADAGLALLVPGEQGEARLVVPGSGAGADTPADTGAGLADRVLPGEVLLIGRGGAVGRARATPAAPAGRDGEGCATWPTARLGAASGADAVPAWTAGLVLPPNATNAPAPIPLDSIEALPAADSAALAAAVTRLASDLPLPRDGHALRGLPFTVRSARRFAIDSAAEGVVAVLGRAVAQEAAPVAETMLLVAERPRGAAAARWTLAYHERATGHEETLPAAEVLAALHLGLEARTALVLARAVDEGSRYTLLERVASGRWRVRWTSVYRGC